jgi:nitric oxide reductase large subunit
MDGLLISAAVIGILCLVGGAVLLFASERLATHLNDRRRLLADPPKRKVSPVLFRAIGPIVFVVGLVIVQISVGTMLDAAF